ncbi:MAG: serine hydrolase [Ilumatobacter sp.]|nr:beta-lactamase family protein [bacterium]NKB41525.1 serine hydrolase [Ilumatobacter sp.]
MRGRRAIGRGGRRPSALWALAVALLMASCGITRAEGADPTARPTAPLPTPPSILDPDTRQITVDPLDENDVVDPASTPSTTTPSTTTTSPKATSTPTTAATTQPALDLGERPLGDPSFGATATAFDRLAQANRGASLTVVRSGEVAFSRASGSTISGQPATSDTPMVVASVSKIVVAMAIARLHEQRHIDAFGPFPWAEVGLDPNAEWADVTIRELLDHQSGLSTARHSWFTGGGTCRDFVPSLLASPPNGNRGRWVYSNGNYCLLGLLVEQQANKPLDAALQQLIFDPVGVSGVHLTNDGLQPKDQPHADGVERLSRLGGAGSLLVSTDDTAILLGRMTESDRLILQPPSVFTDQYGFGHTGTIDGAKACIWVLENGLTVVSATIAGNSVSTGGNVCDIVVPAVSSDLGFGSAKPDRTP